MFDNTMDRKTFLKTVVPALGAGYVSFRISSQSGKSQGNVMSSTISPIDNVVKDVGGDIIDTSYEKPLSDNYNRTRYCEIVGQITERKHPKSRPYLELILKHNSDFRTIFDIPPEYHFALLIQESSFNPYAISPAPAMGIAQFMRPTASDMGMHVYTKGTHPELFMYETTLAQVNKDSSGLFNAAMRNFKRNNFKDAERYKLEYDKVISKRGKLLLEFEQAFRVHKNSIVDDRLNPELAIEKSAKYLALLCRECERHFGGKWWHNILRGIASYNSGLGTTRNNQGLPNIPETVGYIRNIMVMADSLSPKQEAGLDYSTNDKIIAEMITSNRYKIKRLA